MPAPAILCDIGNVIVTFDFSIAASRLAAHSDASAETVLSRLQHLKLPFEDGLMEDGDFVKRAMEEIGYRGSASDFSQAWCEIFAANDAMAASLHRAAATLPLYLLSNTSGLHKDYLFATYPVFGLFRAGVYSYSARHSKPAARIFQIAIEQFNLDPAQTFYIDDLADNIETARRLGLVTHHYSPARHTALEQALDHWMRD